MSTMLEEDSNSIPMSKAQDNPTLRECVAKYVAALADSGDRGRIPILATDLSLYLGTMTPLFDDAMVFWSNYVSEQIRRGPLSPPARRRVVRYIPMRDPDFRSISAAQEYWLRAKVNIHWLLCPGAYHLVTFGKLHSSEIEKLNYCVVPKVVLVGTPGLYDGDFSTRVARGSRGGANQAAEFVDQFLSTESLDDIDPETQVVFPLYYTQGNFRSPKLSRHHLREVLGRFLWKLQSGICPLCGIGVRYRFEDMEVDHVLAWTRGGNNTLLNLEMKCHEHNHPKNRRVSETQDYLIVLRRAFGIWSNRPAIAHFVQMLFSLEARSVAFPVYFEFGIP